MKTGRKSSSFFDFNFWIDVEHFKIEMLENLSTHKEHQNTLRTNINFNVNGVLWKCGFSGKIRYQQAVDKSDQTILILKFCLQRIVFRLDASDSTSSLRQPAYKISAHIISKFIKPITTVLSFKICGLCVVQHMTFVVPHYKKWGNRQRTFGYKTNKDKQQTKSNK